MFDISTETFLALSGWGLLLVIFAAPFVQEDVAVIGAATASVLNIEPTAAILTAIMLGLIGSDAWKYWMGRLARRHDWAHKFAEKPGVSVAGDLINKEFVPTMLTARFVPGTRIPTYIAAGFFKAHYGKYILTLALTAALYVASVFGLFHVVGMVAGEDALIWLPIAAVVLLVSYIVYRWLNHTSKHEGPMTPMSKEFDHPIPDVEDCIEEDEHEHEKEKVEA